VAGLERCVDRSELNQRSTQRTGPRAPKRTHWVLRARRSAGSACT